MRLPGKFVGGGKPLLTALSETRAELDRTLHDMASFTEKHLPSKARRKAGERMSVESLYDALYSRAKPRIEKAIAEKEAELEALLDGFGGLSPKLKERANKRGEALQKEIEVLQSDLADLRVPWERLQADLVARQEALERATATLNQEGHFRQKAEALKTVVDRIVRHFSRQTMHTQINRPICSGGRDRQAPHLFRNLSPNGLVSWYFREFNA